MEIKEFEQNLLSAIEQSVIEFVQKGDYFQNYYDNRIDVMPLVKRVYKNIDSERLEKLIISNLEEVLAKKIVDKLVTEMGTDIKNLMGNATVRDDFRFFLRAGVQKILDKVKE